MTIKDIGFFLALVDSSPIIDFNARELKKLQFSTYMRTIKQIRIFN